MNMVGVQKLFMPQRFVSESNKENKYQYISFSWIPLYSGAFSLRNKTTSTVYIILFDFRAASIEKNIFDLNHESLFQSDQEILPSSVQRSIVVNEA